MAKHNLLTLQCSQSDCRFRFPMYELSDPIKCPKCGAKTEIIKDQFSYQKANKEKNKYTHCHIEALFDNIRSAYNVGSMFRSADGSGIMHIHLCGMTPTPDHPRLAKTALGAEFSVPWTYHPDAIATARNRKEHGYRIWSLEECEHSISIFDSLGHVEGSPILLIVGNEVCGVDPGFDELCERYIFIPMLGYKRSLNVATAFGIATYLLNFAENIRSKSLLRVT